MAALADAGWAALERQHAHGWELRFASGVTKRANSAWPVAGTADASTAAIAAVERRYLARGLRPVFQLAADDEEALLGLVGRGYRVVDETLVMTAAVPAPAAAARDPEVVIAEEPDAEWLAAWWAVDGRGGEAELEVARRIMLGTPALYAAVRAGGAVASVARLALVGAWGGLYCVATLPAQRRRGHGARVVGALLAAAAERGVTDAWLQVLAGNESALALYSGRFGFHEAGRYRYLVAPRRD
jgi:ribosomal protein S18 acetylase RimI-like enzyme